jgi:hypothetical protein
MKGYFMNGMSKEECIKFIKYLHYLEERESKQGLFITDSTMLINEIKQEFIKLYNCDKKDIKLKDL